MKNKPLPKFAKLNAVERTKRTVAPCEHCNLDINSGDRFMDVKYFDGFLDKLFGRYHVNCWKDFLNTK